MKLRNKQTRKVYTVRKDIFVSIIDTGKIEVRVMTPDGHVSFFYRSFDEMLNDWEDYKPTEPLIKDEKVRKAVRAWAEANDIEQVMVEKGFSTYTFFPTDTGKVDISVWTEPSLSHLSKDKTYTIAELCREEEECES